MIEGLVVHDLKQIVDERGKVMHMIRSDSILFTRFGEVYFSKINPKFIKGWKKHLRMTQIFAVPVGMIRIVIFDDRTDSKSYGELTVLEIGENNYCLLKIPPRVWYSFKAISAFPALIANCTDLPHDPTEAEKADIDDHKIPYKWE